MPGTRLLSLRECRPFAEPPDVSAPLNPPTPARTDIRSPGGHTEIRSIMKLIIAIIQPDKLEAVQKALTDVEVYRLTVLDVQGFGRQLGFTEVYRGHEFKVNLLKKVQIEIAVNDNFVQPTIEAIMKGGRTEPDGKIGDGKIFILPLEECIRIRTGERGSDAI